MAEVLFGSLGALDVVPFIVVLQYEPRSATRVPVTWDRTAVAFHPADSTGVEVPWRGLRRICAVDPWPSLHVEWQDGTVRRQHRIEFDPDQRRAAEAGLVRLFAEAERRLPRGVERGWLDHPVVGWEPVDRFPHELDGQGAYRSSARDQADPVIAQRSTKNLLEAVLCWLAARAAFGWNDQAREVAVTERWVYVRRRDGSAWRVPRTAKRLCLRTEGGDPVVIFGRNTALLLPRRRACPVVQALGF